ncbi:MAG: 30S ribosomal protein S17 [Candidatus Nanoarchaeia archaeon]|nr:30S ribosomal protein S17 [Candidatus Nanoarchaeia archaeon]
MKKEKQKTRKLGIEVKEPKSVCTDRHCPFHGELGLHGRTFTGKIATTDYNRTASIVWERSVYLPKYERYELRRSKVKAHNPDCIGAKVGDMVKIMECRPISKTKSFVVIEKLGKEE